MTIKQLFQKAFVGGQWYVAYRRKGEAQYKVIETPKGMWIADPIIYAADGEHYLFVEVFEKKKKKAAIGYYYFNKGAPIYKGVILENSYHMSYPCVFQYQDAYYMIPESSANKTMTLYKAIQFPDKWKKDKDLLTGEKLVDTTVVTGKGGLYLLSYRKVVSGWELVKYNLNMKDKTVDEDSSIFYKKNIARPAGYLFNVNDRPAQNCSRKYGESLYIYRMDSERPYREHIVRTVEISRINVAGKFDRVHTYTQDKTFEVVDLYKEKIDIFHGIKIFIRAYLKK